MSKSFPRPRRARGTVFGIALLAIAAALSLSSTAIAGTSRSQAVASASAVSRSVHTAATRSIRTDRSLVGAAAALKRCLSAHARQPKRCAAARRAVQRAGSTLAGAERSFARIARGTAGSRSSARRAPLVSVHGDTLAWTRVSKAGYVVSRKVPGQGEADLLVNGTSVTPPPVPGVTVSYSVRSTVAGSAWSTPQSITYGAGSTSPGGEAHTSGASAGAPVDTQASPTISVAGLSLSWNAVGNVSTYVLEASVAGEAPRYSEVSGTSVTPEAVAGTTVSYSVRTAVDGSAWSPAVTISYPAAPASGPTAPSAPSGPKIIGTNGGAGWGDEAAATILAGHITWNRVEIGMASNTVPESISDGFHVLGIVGNIEDNQPLSQVNPASWGRTVVEQLTANPGIAIAEAGNEMYLKGAVANPVRYGEMYLDAVNDMRAAGIHTPLLFNMTGDIPTGSWSSPTGWSQDANNGGWLRDAVDAVPGLAAAIRENGISVHPYGALDEDREDSAGVAAVPTEEAVAKNVLGATPSFYISEFGYNLGACGAADGACSEAEQASKMRAAYQSFLADPHVAGIWAYSSHDDPTGQWGYMNHEGSVRPVFSVISSFAAEQGE